MFAPSLAEVRSFFCEAWRKHLAGEPLTPIEAIAADCAKEHPEYHPALADPQRALGEDYSDGRENPFLHLSLHLAVHEQVSIDQPPGIRAEVERLARARGSWHEGLHEAMRCLARALERANGPSRAAPNELAADYLDCLRRR